MRDRGVVRLEQERQETYGALWKLVAVMGCFAALAIAVPLVASSSLRDAVPWFGMAGLLVLITYRAGRDTFVVCHAIELDRSTGVVTPFGPFGRRRRTSAQAFSEATLRTWRQEDHTLVLAFGTQEVVLRTGTTPEVRTLVADLDETRSRLGASGTISLEIEEPDPNGARARNRTSRNAHHFTLLVDDKVCGEDSLPDASGASTVTLVQRPLDLYRYPLHFGVVALISWIPPLFGELTGAHDHLLATLSYEGVALALLLAVFLPLTWNTRRLELDRSNGDVWATLVRRREHLGTVTSGLRAEPLHKPWGSQQVKVTVGDERALLRTKQTDAIDWWLHFAGERARQAGAEVAIPEPVTDPVAGTRASKGANGPRGHWTLIEDDAQV